MLYFSTHIPTQLKHEPHAKVTGIKPFFPDSNAVGISLDSYMPHNLLPTGRWLHCENTDIRFISQAFAVWQHFYTKQNHFTTETQNGSKMT